MAEFGPDFVELRQLDQEQQIIHARLDSLDSAVKLQRELLEANTQLCRDISSKIEKPIKIIEAAESFFIALAKIGEFFKRAINCLSRIAKRLLPIFAVISTILALVITLGEHDIGALVDKFIQKWVR